MRKQSFFLLPCLVLLAAFFCFPAFAHAADAEYSWLVYVYLCGSDLESENAMGSADFEEMAEACAGTNLAFLVETGGSFSWANDDISADVQSRFLIADGEYTLLETAPSANMGESGTLADFLLAGDPYGLTGAHTGLIFWDHGSGSINGVCFDEKYDYDSLSLAELSEALGASGKTFDFIGFDACLMGSYETASALSGYADYMIASEELVPGYGWDYGAFRTAWENGAEDVETLGALICEAYYESCAEADSEETATLSVIDLSALPSLNDAFDDAAAAMVEGLSDTQTLSSISNGIARAENYGGNNDAEGYSNMVDLGNLLENISESIPEAEAALEALENAVVYEIHGSGRANASGLSIYYPLKVQGSSELDTFASSNPSQNYVAFAKGMLYGAGTGSLEDYDSSSGFLIAGLVNDMLEEEESLGVGSDGAVGIFSEAAASGGGYAGQLSFAEDPYINEDGYYTFTLPAEDLDYVQWVTFDLFQEIPEQEGVSFYLGNDDNVVMDWDTGVATDNFSGVWPSLPDGQELMYYILEETDAYILYTAPVLYNGEETCLRFQWQYEDPEDLENFDGEFVVLGVWNGMDDESGAFSREYEELVPGDVICPIYYGYSEDGEEDTWYGEDFTIENGFAITEQTLREGTYEYYFDIVDIFGNSLYSDPVWFYVDEDGNVELL